MRNNSMTMLRLQNKNKKNVPDEKQNKIRAKSHEHINKFNRINESDHFENVSIKYPSRNSSAKNYQRMFNKNRENTKKFSLDLKDRNNSRKKKNLNHRELLSHDDVQNMLSSNQN